MRPSIDTALLFARPDPVEARVGRAPDRERPAVEARVGRAPDRERPAAEARAAEARPAEARRALSFDDVYEQHFDYVWCSVRRMGVPEGSADDAVQDVFLVVHRRLHEFEGRASLKTWLFQIVLRVASDHRRALRRKQPCAEGEGGVDADSIADERAVPADDGLAQRQGVRLMYRLLDALDDDKRAVFVMAELEQMSAPEIAEALGVNLNTIYARLRAARREFEQAAARERAREGWRVR